ncbi:hypothetical protein H8B13_18205 [Hymenobacter sp. BT188]|uniref:DUF5908 family protein n=1 Tax=Hymenobacter sp. BT188 TaxID=2763504 RepID=UPI00165189FF|nr:DUF5908 family protein [Hymenobacter sp. BT188]MBC6608767.1 hypothetical protein [Hymenobacter sp. BT188]
MPIEIKELHIRFTVNTVENGHHAAPLPGLVPARNGSTEAEKQAMVAECVEQVLQILQAKKER